MKNRNKKDCVGYERPVPGDRVQMDTCKISPRLYQYEAPEISLTEHQRYWLNHVRACEASGRRITGFAIEPGLEVWASTVLLVRQINRER